MHFVTKCVDYIASDGRMIGKLDGSGNKGTLL
jgi:hypothetical protein